MPSSKRDEHLLSRNDPDAIAFADAARAYCEFLEWKGNARPEAFYTTLFRMLVTLLDRVEPLPCYAPDMSKRAERAFEKEHQDVYAELNSSVVGLLSDDSKKYEKHGFVGDEDERSQLLTFFTDIVETYGDLKRGLLWWEKHDELSEEQAIWEWRFGYEHHWGEHAIEALWVIHRFRFNTLFD